MRALALVAASTQDFLRSNAHLTLLQRVASKNIKFPGANLTRQHLGVYYKKMKIRKKQITAKKFAIGYTA